MITYQEISLSELHNRILEIDVSERGSVVFRLENGKLVAYPENWQRPPWTSETWRQDSWFLYIRLPGVKTWGAFENNRLAGFTMYRPHLTETSAQLAALFVSKDHRRQGIAKTLTETIRCQAKLDGHTILYVSATPSESAVNFYLRQGFVPTQETHLELFSLEPEDIHMIKEL